METVVGLRAVEGGGSTASQLRSQSRRQESRIEDIERQLLEAHGLSLTGWRVLSFVAAYPGLVGLRKIRSHVHNSKANLTEVSDTLVRAGLAEKSRNPADQRCAMVGATERGRRIVDEIEPRMREAVDAHFGKLDLADQIQLSALLAKLT